MSKFVRTLTVLLLFAALVGCETVHTLPAGEYPAATFAPTALVPIASCEVLRQKIIDATIQSHGLDLVVVYEEKTEFRGFLVGEDVAEASLDSAGVAESNALSKTNVQVANVDEADFVEAVSTTAYYQLNEKLYAFDTSSPGLMSSSNKIEQRIGLYGDEQHGLYRLAQESVNGGVNVYRYAPVTTSNEDDFTPISELTLSGNYIQSRRIGKNIIIVQQSHVNQNFRIQEKAWHLHYEIEAHYQSSKEPGYYRLSADELAEIRKAVEASITIYDVEDLIEKSGAYDQTDCSQVLVPETGISGASLLHLTVLDENINIVQQQFVLGSGHDIYMDERFLLVSGWGHSTHQSPVFAFEFTNATLQYTGFAVVNGIVPSQWAMHINNETLYVASQSRGSEGNYSRLSSYQIKSGEFEKLDQTAEIAPGETMRSVRFIRDKAYMVTFRQIDPLFAIDTADPNNLAILGELKIPGFSSYIHPLSDNKLLTIGFSGDDGGLDGGISIQTFNVSDPTKPNKIDEYQIGGIDNSYASSPAQYDHHAFSYSPQWNLLTVPYTLSQYRQNSESQNAHLAFVRIESDGKIDGTATHTKVGSIETRYYYEDDCFDQICPTRRSNNQTNSLERTVFDYAHNEVVGFAPNQIIRFDAEDGEILERYALE